jgi:HSP20 family protein
MNNEWTAPVKRIRLSPISLVQKQVAGLLDDIITNFGDVTNFGLDKSQSFIPRIEMHEDEHGLTVRAEVPGMKVEDIEISFNKSELSIRGERKEEFSETKPESGVRRSEWLYGAFQRTIPLSFEIDEDSIDASVKDGILTVLLPRSRQARSEIKKVSIRKA